MSKLLNLVALLVGGAHGFYVPGANPQSFAEGERVRLKVNKMTSTKSLLPVEYYQLPFCHPPGGPKMDNQNFGQFLAGDRIESSPYVLEMKKEKYCEQLCVSNVGRGEQKGMPPNEVVRAIRNNYHNNWIVDNLSSASKMEDDTTITTRYWQGFPVGYISDENKKAYINNHVNIEIMYHLVETEAGKYRIVRFTVEPFSIKHDFEFFVEDDDRTSEDAARVTLINPIASCDPKAKSKVHTHYEMIAGKGRHAQLASGEVLFTYDVTWVENLDLKWASRWDIYLSMDHAIPAEVHWLSIANSFVIVFVLSVVIAAILVRNLRCDVARYNKLANDEENAEDLKAFEWKLVHADVFRPPAFSPLLLSVACGTGAQILCMSLLTIIFSAMGFLSPANRGALLMAELLLYVMMGGVAGYVTARLYKTFEGKSWQKATTCTALGFPGIAFTFFFIVDIMALAQHSTYAVPFSTLVVLLVLWFGILTPLVFFGAYLGYKQEAMEFPTNTSSIPRQIPDQSWFKSIPVTLAIGGILPFGACFVELYFILASVWMDQYYYVFGFLFLVYFIVLITCAEITVLFCYFQLCGENYHWWWRSFCTAGSTALYVFFYSFVYFKQLEANSFTAYVLYFGYMGLVCFGLFLMTGFIGVASSLWFNKTIYSSSRLSKEGRLEDAGVVQGII